MRASPGCGVRSAGCSCLNEDRSPQLPRAPAGMLGTRCGQSERERGGGEGCLGCGAASLREVVSVTLCAAQSESIKIFHAATGASRNIQPCAPLFSGCYSFNANSNTVESIHNTSLRWSAYSCLQRSMPWHCGVACPRRHSGFFS